MGKPTTTWARTFCGFVLRWSAVGNVHGMWVDDAQPFPWKLDIRVENSGKYMLGFSILHVGASVEWPWELVHEGRESGMIKARAEATGSLGLRSHKI